MAENYIIVRVRERPGHDLDSDTGMVRRVIHDAAQRYGLEVADNSVLTTRSEMYDGSPQPVAEAEALFRKVMLGRGTP